MVLRGLARVVGLGLVVVGCGSGEGAPGVAREGIYQGARELGEPWAVMVYYQRPGTTKLRLCTGSVVAPRVVVTAKHCVFDEPTEDVWVAVDVGAFTVAVGDDYATSVEREIGVARVVTTPGVYASAQARSGDDLALLELVADAGVAPKALAAAPPAVGDALRIVGFGFTEADVLGAKHAGAATVSAVGAGTFESAGPAWTCTGDSGGPALHAGTGALLGVTSFGPAGCDVPESYYTRIDRHAALLGEVGLALGGGAGAGGAAGMGAGGEAGVGMGGGAGAPAGTGGADDGSTEASCALSPAGARRAGAMWTLGGLVVAWLAWARRRHAEGRRRSCASS
ncbi:MAG: S1 family peptidase [Polyangiaceae bacterium]|nr:S1 family peptidase [Polyangiaceae bacterium]